MPAGTEVTIFTPFTTINEQGTTQDLITKAFNILPLDYLQNQKNSGIIMRSDTMSQTIDLLIGKHICQIPCITEVIYKKCRYY